MSDSSFAKYASVVLDVSIDKLLDYGIPQQLADLACRGMPVEVPVKGFNRTGYIYEIKDFSTYSQVQAINRFLSDVPVITEDLFELSLWMCKYYCVSLKDTLKMILPASVRRHTNHKQQLFVMRAKTREALKVHCEQIRNKFSAQASILDIMLKVKKGILLTELLEKSCATRSPVDTLVKQGFLSIDIVRIDRSPLINEDYFQTKHKILNQEQAEALQRITNTIENDCFETHLLYGVTGSGKTEVYLQAIDRALKKQKSAIMLVPEISLTAQTIERFRSRFEGKIAILHHRLSHGERFDEWQRICRGEAQIVIGARSAVFSPVKNLGLIIVDEEHEHSYKQSESSPCYHAREIAVMRGKMSKSTVILGSATPSLESYYNALSGKYILSTLKNRAETARIPKFTIVDMQKEFEKTKGYTNFSETLLKAIKERYSKGEQSILFLNRRGFHTTLLCKACSQVVRCPHCDVALTFHLGDNHLACHLCNFTLCPPPSQCPHCKSPHTMKYRGVGTEQIQKALHAIFPDIRTLRIDADTTKHKGSHQRLLREFGSGKADLLIGTQMIAKGLHFPGVTLVGVLNSDVSLNIPDFRASEVAFQLITQVAGRSGRGHLNGEVIIQTCLPNNPTINLAAEQNFNKFYIEEIAVRQLFKYPPFANLAKLTFSGPQCDATREVAEKWRSKLIPLFPSTFELHAVVPAGHAKIKDKYRFQLLIRGPSVYAMSEAFEKLKKDLKLNKDIHILIDINPTSTFF